MPDEGKEKSHEAAQKTDQQVDRQVKSLSKAKVVGSELISAKAFEEQARLKIFGKKSFLGFKRKGKSDDFFNGVSEKLRQYQGPLQGKGMAEKVHFLKNMVEHTASWLRGRGKKSKRSKIVEALIVQLTTEVDRLQVIELVACVQGAVGRRKKATAGEIPVEVIEIDQKLAQKITSLAGPEKNQVRKAMMGYISDTEIEATMSRLRSLAEFLKPIINKKNGEVISKV